MLKFKELSLDDEKHLNDIYLKKDKTSYFNIFPRVFPVGKTGCIVIESDQYVLSGTYLVMVIPYYEFEYKSFENYKDTIFKVEAADGKLKFSYYFPSEQLYRVIVGESHNGVIGQLLKTTVYALDEDMFCLKPLAGDFHSHTIFSDGFDTPELVLRAAIRHGLDFIAVTDHNNYQGSIEAARIARDKKLPITVINGEEYSSSFTNMHIISLGAKKALPQEEYIFQAGDKEIKSTVEYTVELCRKITENGGVSVMCHPLWKPFHIDGSRLDVPLSLVKELMEKNVFDAIEVVGGSPIVDQMTSQMQYTYAVCFGAYPGSVAYLGSTDSHNYTIDPIGGRHFTLVFAADNSQEAIVNAVRLKKTVAVQTVDAENYLLYGEPRYCMFAKFFLKELSTVK